MALWSKDKEMDVASDALTTGQRAALGAAVASLRESGLFGEIELKAGGLWAHHPGEAEAAYRIELGQGNEVAASWSTPDRYLSQSIEAELMWTRDDLDDMLDEELSDLGWSAGRLKPLKHYRDEREQFVFRTTLPMRADELIAAHGDDLARCILAFERVFSELGDMKDKDIDDD